jgi:hypothetical protein
MRRILPPHRLLLLAALALAQAPATALAASGPALAWPGPEVAAGQVVELSWGELPAGIDELEILLSLDDGRSFPIRVTPELDAHERSFRWRVPNLPAGRARLRMRLGSERAEIEGGPGEPFRIVESAAPSASGPLFHEGGFWTGLDTCRPRAPDTFAPGARLQAADAGGGIAETPPRYAVEPPAPDAAAADPPGPRTDPPTPHAPLTRAPEFVPQRK